ncbi:hypothetical protein PRIPAC_87143, partial [Pristionchus pacificus]|uniref:Uncharacterized protein n=1 Tax=Pristionchus pacificus TaxID=54126 RepID=A0A2A6B960_PRIPA
FPHFSFALDGRPLVLLPPSLRGPIPTQLSIALNKQTAAMSTVSKQRRASGSGSCLSLTGNDVSEMMLPPFLKNDTRSKPELIEHSFRLQRLSDHKTSYNLKIKWCEREPTKAEFDHDINMSIKDIQRTHRIGRSVSAPMLSARVEPKPEPQYISIGDAGERKGSKVVARAIAQVRRDGHIVRMLFRDEHSPSATLPDVVNAVIRQLDAVGTRPDVYVLSKNSQVARPNTTFRYDSLPAWRLSELVADPSKELHVAVDFSYELAKVK